MEQAPQVQRAEMQVHLDSGCQQCAQFVSLWTRVSQIAGRERSLVPPNSAVQHVRAAFSRIAAARQTERTPVIPRIAFDSLWQPALAGIRSGSGGARKLLYKARGITIEMHLENESKSERVNLTGQISIASLRGDTMPSFVVVVSGEEGILAKTVSNGFGEFHVSFVLEEDLQVSLEMTGGAIVVIPLGKSESPGK
jgi:hypothetical protein